MNKKLLINKKIIKELDTNYWTRQFSTKTQFVEVHWSSVKTPTTVDEFRLNLKLYYMTVGDKLINSYLVTRDCWVNIDKINCLDDIFKFTKKYSSTPQITPLFETSDNGGRIFRTIHCNTHQLIRDLKKVNFELMWVNIDTPNYKELFTKTLGEPFTSKKNY